jgi:hypothetical protein
MLLRTHQSFKWVSETVKTFPFRNVVKMRKSSENENGTKHHTALLAGN